MSKSPTTARTAVFSMIKNEGDIIGDFLDQTLELFDSIYIIDHESRDGTYEVCRQIAAKDNRVHLYRLSSSGYPQSRVTTWFAHEIFRRDQPEWLFLLDADEFLPFNSKKEFQNTLGKLPKDKCLGMVWRNIVPEDLDEWKGLSAMTFLEATRQGPFPKVAIPRSVMNAIGEKLTVFQGNHGVGIDEKHPAEVRDAPFVMHHIPYRSVRQAEQKLLLGNLAYYNDPSRRLGKGFHWVQMADEHYVSVDTRRTTILEQVGSYSQLGKGNPTDSEDLFKPCLYRFDYPKMCDRTILERSRHLTSVLILWREVERFMAARKETNSTSIAPGEFIISDSEGKMVFISSNEHTAGSQEVENLPPGNKDESSNQDAPCSTISNTGNAEPATDTPASLTADTSRPALLKQVYEWMNVPPSSIPLSAWTGHLAFLNALIGLARPSRIVELGVDKGCSFLAMCDACRAHGLDAELIGVDTWAGDPHAGEYDGDAIYDGLTRHLILTYPMARLIRSDFATARERVPDGIVDLLHIDGYHTYEAVSHDFSTWFSSLSDRGICMFHDIAVKERDFGVYRLWEELKAKWPSIEFLHCFGLGILFVGKNQPPAIKEFLSIWNSSEAVRESLRSAAELFASTFPARLQAVEAERELVRLQQSVMNAHLLNTSVLLRYARVIVAKSSFARRIAQSSLGRRIARSIF